MLASSIGTHDPEAYFKLFPEEHISEDGARIIGDSLFAPETMEDYEKMLEILENDGFTFGQDDGLGFPEGDKNPSEWAESLGFAPVDEKLEKHQQAMQSHILPFQ